MHGLGYTRYVAHGGDAGSFITRQMGVAQPDGLVGIHVLEIWAFPTGAPGELDGLTDAGKERIAFMAGYYDLAGYQGVHQTRPLTVAYGLTDSPAGLLAWIGDPLMGFGRYAPPEPRDRDAVLTNVSIYWFTEAAGSSARWYFEDARTGAGGPEAPNPTPTGVALFPTTSNRCARSQGARTTSSIGRVRSRRPLRGARRVRAPRRRPPAILPSLPLTVSLKTRRRHYREETLGDRKRGGHTTADGWMITSGLSARCRGVTH
ncbi:MAG: hypothetical protein ACRDNS_20600 [Trebonia sp.]